MFNKKFIVAFACLFMTVASVPLPLATEDTVEQEAYSVIYDGPAGKHVQFGEPGKAVRGYYTFFDSNGKKQKVTYEADNRGYRVKATAVIANDTIEQPLNLGFHSERGEVAVVTNEQELIPVETPLPSVPLKTVAAADAEAPTQELYRPIRFKEAKSDLSLVTSYNLGYPFLPGNYIYAL